MVKQLSHFKLTHSANSFVYCSEFIPFFFVQQFFFSFLFYSSVVDDKDKVARCAHLILNDRSWGEYQVFRKASGWKRVFRNVNMQQLLYKQPNSGWSNSINSLPQLQTQFASGSWIFIYLIVLTKSLWWIVESIQLKNHIEIQFARQIQIFSQQTHTHTNTHHQIVSNQNGTKRCRCPCLCR